MSITAHDIYRVDDRYRRRWPASRAISPAMIEIASVMLVALFYAFVDGLLGADHYRYANMIGPAVLSAILATSAFTMIKGNGRILWTPLFWFRLSTTAYFGIGSLVIYLVGDDLRTYLEGFFAFSDEDIFKLNLVVACSVVLVLLAAKAGIHVYARLNATGQRRVRQQSPDSGKGMFVAAMIFLIVGLSVNYLLIVPSRMGLTSVVLPGAFANFAQFTPIGVFLITLWSLRHARSLLVFILLLVGLEMTMSILMFLKATMLMLLIMVALAFLWDKVTTKKLAFFGATVVFAFVAVSPVIGEARYEIKQRYGGNAQAGFAERFEILRQSLSRDTADFNERGKHDGLLRLSYVNAATFVIQLYDAGDSSDWPQLIPAVFVPRVLWPDKPVISDIGFDIYELSRGHRSSSTGAGLFAEAYWAMGWLGLVVFMPVYGFIIGFLTNFSVETLRDERWLYAPVVLMALYMGFRTDGHYITDVAGATVILVALYIGLRITNVFLKLFFTNSHTP